MRVVVTESVSLSRSVIEHKHSLSSPTLHIVKDHPTLPHDAEIHLFGWPLIDTDSKVAPPPPLAKCHVLEAQEAWRTRGKLGIG